jgi:hypothetical protein
MVFIRRVLDDLDAIRNVIINGMPKHDPLYERLLGLVNEAEDNLNRIDEERLLYLIKKAKEIKTAIDNISLEDD